MASAKLYNFAWQGVSMKGMRMKGRLLAYNEREARQVLAEQRVNIHKIKRCSTSSWSRRRNKATPQDITLFSRQMATMLDAGVSLSQSLSLIKASVKKAEMKRIISKIQFQLEAGSTFSLALKQSSRLFDDFYCDLVTTGEQTGRLEHVFARLAHYREKSEVLRSKVIKALIYPVMVAIIALIVSVIMLVFIIPVFENLFSSFNSELPWFTRQVLALSRHLQDSALYWAIIIAMIYFISSQAIKRNANCQLFFSKFILKLPILGDILTKAALARFSRTLATTFNAGVPLLEGLSAARKTAKNPSFEQIIIFVQQQTADGIPLHAAIRETDAFPDMMMQMIMIGEESGALDHMLHKVANIYEADVDNTVDNLGKIFEPLIIVVLGVLIGSLVVAMYLPMFNLMSNF